MSGGGGKGGRTTQQTSSVQRIPGYIEAPLKRNIARAEDIQKIGYTPFMGPDVAAFNPTQTAAMQMNVDTARTFGMLPQGQQDLVAAQGMAPAQDFNGVQGYSSAPLYEQAVQAAAQANPEQAARYNKLFV